LNYAELLHNMTEFFLSLLIVSCLRHVRTLTTSNNVYDMLQMNNGNPTRILIYAIMHMLFYNIIHIIYQWRVELIFYEYSKNVYKVSTVPLMFITAFLTQQKSLNKRFTKYEYICNDLNNLI